MSQTKKQPVTEQLPQTDLAQAHSEAWRLRRLLRGVLHEFANLHTGALGNIDRASEDVIAAGCGECHGRLIRVRTCLEQACELAASLLDCSDGWAVPMACFDAETALCAVIRRVGEDPRFAGRPITLVGALAHEVRGHRPLIEAAVENLVRNALEVMGSSPAVGLRLELKCCGADGVTVRVIDPGPGCDGVAPRRGHRHWGVGLEFVNLVAGLHGGRLERRHRPGGPGTVFTLHLPILQLPTEGARP